jgi:hypothetical protein
MVGGSPASSTTKTGRHDIAEILLKVALNTKIQNSNSFKLFSVHLFQMQFGQFTYEIRGRRGSDDDRMVVGFTCDKVCQ